MKSIALVGAALLLTSLVGCSPADTEVVAPGESAAPSVPAAPTAENQCGGLTTEDLLEIFEVELEGPEPSTGDSDQDGITWTSTGCDWEGDNLEIDLDISEGSDFPSGSVECLEPVGAGEVTEVEGIGNQAWWKFGDANESEGELRVCTDDRLVELEVDAEDGSMSSDELLEKAQSAVRIVVE